MMKSYTKRYSIHMYDEWDLNCPRVYKSRGRGKLCKVMRRATRRNMKQDLKKELDKLA